MKGRYLACAAALGAAGASCLGQVFDLQTEFGVEANPNGTWSYGYSPVLDGAFVLYDQTYHVDEGEGWTSPSLAGCWRNLTDDELFGVGPGEVSLHPGQGGEPSIVRWTAPATGVAHVVGAFEDGDQGDLDGYIIHNGLHIRDLLDMGNQEWPFDMVLNVREDDVIDFVVTGGYLYGNTPLHATIELTLACAADMNGDGLLNIFDFLAFQSAFSNGDPAADFAAPFGVLNIFDFLAFQTAFGDGC